MPNVEVKRGRSVRPIAPGGVQISPGAFNAESRAMARFGSAVQQFGATVAGAIERSQALQEARDLQRGGAAYEKLLDDNALAQLNEGDYTKWGPQFLDAHDKGFETITADMSPQAVKKFKPWADRQRHANHTRIQVDAHRQGARDWKDGLPRQIQQSADLWIVDPEGSDQKWDDDMEAADKAGLITKDGPGSREGLNRDRVMVKGQTYSQREAAVMSEIMKGSDEEAQTEMIKLGLFTDADVKLLASTDMEFLRKYAGRELASQQAENKVALEAEQENQQQAILDKFLAADFENIDTFINAQTTLEAKDKLQWMGYADNWAKQVNGDADITTDPRAEAALQQRALDVSTGAVSRADLYEELIKARYGDKPTIDDDAFQQINTLAAREHKAYQANAMKEAYSAGTQLLSEGQIELIAAAQVTEEEDINAVLKRLGGIRKQEEENFRQYKRAMSQWFEAEVAAGRDPNDDDIYKKSRAMLVHYRQRAIDESIFTTELGEQGDLPKEGKFGKPGTAVKTGGETIGTVDKDGLLLLNDNGMLRLLRITGNDVVRAREIIAERGFREPD